MPRFSLRTSPVHCSGEESIRTLLSVGADPRQIDNLGYTVLHKAAISKHETAAGKVYCLIEVGAGPNNRALRSGEPPLQNAADKKIIVMAKALLDNGADMNILDHNGDSALLQSTHSNANDVKQLLLSRGADHTVWDSTGNSLLHGAALSGGCRTLDIFRNAKLRNIDPDARNRQNKTAMQLAYARTSAPVGFVDKFRERLADIRTRNAKHWEEQTQDHAIHQSVKWPQVVRPSWSVHLRRRFADRCRHMPMIGVKNAFKNVIPIAEFFTLALGFLRLCFVSTFSVAFQYSNLLLLRGRCSIREMGRDSEELVWWMAE